MSVPFTADSDVTADSSITVDNPPGFSAQYPNVPAMAGVPLLARQQTAAVVSAAASGPGLNAALAAQLGLPPGTVFGSSSLYTGLNLEPLDPNYGFLNASNDTGELNYFLIPDSVVELEVSADSTINSHPIERGQFEAYNRVQNPARVRLLLACQGKKMAYTDFLSTLKSLREGTETITLALPNDSYDNMALKGYGYARKAERGAMTIWADTQWEEERSTNVMVSAPPTTEPQGEAPVDLGSLSPAFPSLAQQAAISNPPFVPAQYTNPQQVAAGITAMGNGGSPPSGAAQ